MNTIRIMLLLIAFSIGVSATPSQTNAQVDPSSITSVVWSPDGSKIAVASLDSTIEIWDSSGATLITTLYEYTTQIISNVAWSPDSQMLAGVSVNNTVNVWNIASGQIQVRLDEGIEDNIYSVAWSPDGAKLAAGSVSEAYTLHIWEATTWQEIARPEVRSSAGVIRWSPDGSKIAIAAVNAVLVWNTETWVREMTYEGFGYAALLSIEWNTSGTDIASSSTDRTARIIDITTAQTLLTLQHATVDLVGTNAYVWDVAWSPDNTMIATTGADGTVKVWDTSTGELVTTYVASEHKILSVDWSPDGQYIAYGGEGGIFDIIPAPEFLSCDFEVGDNNYDALTTAITPAILGNISTKGNQATLTRDPSADPFRFFEVASGGSLTLNNLTLSNGAVNAQGGAILNNGTLTLNNITFRNNVTHRAPDTGAAEGVGCEGAIYTTLTGSLTTNGIICTSLLP